MEAEQKDTKSIQKITRKIQDYRGQNFFLKAENEVLITEKHIKWNTTEKWRKHHPQILDWPGLPALTGITEVDQT